MWYFLYQRGKLVLDGSALIAGYLPIGFPFLYLKICYSEKGGEYGN